MEACVHKAPNGATRKMARLFVRSLVGWGFFFPPWYFLLIGMQFRIETHLLFFFFNLRQRDLSLKGNTTSNKQH